MLCSELAQLHIHHQFLRFPPKCEQIWMKLYETRFLASQKNSTSTILAVCVQHKENIPKFQQMILHIIPSYEAKLFGGVPKSNIKFLYIEFVIDFYIWIFIFRFLDF